jgi:hypothetical protein
LARHRDLSEAFRIFGKFAAADVAAGTRKGNVLCLFTTDEYGSDTMEAVIETIETLF